ncbi:YdgA family protein [Serratia liquefaciens]|uniref:YdgA family protein n=1 Tax=Serratia liquefaciens TaxID=614 RepID=UPI00061B8692|nr:YdgA family protein [Serratia liquefaciens]AKE10605.1 GTP-binding protein YdgA [Serratia liquefaciens]
MKKSLVALSTVVVLGAAWTGASWYTGKLIEQQMGAVVDNANSLLKSNLPKAGVKLGYENYQRGIFSSKLRYVLRADGSVTTDDAPLKAGDKVAFQETIDHGPFPFAQLKKLNLLPSMASVHTELENTPATNGLFDITKGKSLFTAESRISYSGDISSTIDVIPLDYQKDKSALIFAGATINADVSRDMKAITLDANSGSVIIRGPNQLGQATETQFLGTTLKSQTHTGQFDISLGNLNLMLKQIKVAVDGKDTLLLGGFKLASQLDEKDGNLKGQIDYSIDTLKVKNSDFGAGKLSVKIDKLDAKSLKEFVDRYNQQAITMLQQAQAMDPTAYQQQRTDILLQNLPLLWKGNPSISIAPLSWKNSKGESTFTLNLDLDLTDPVQAGSPATSMEKLITRTVKRFDLNLSIPVAMATETAAQLTLSQGYSAEESQKLAQQQVQGLATMGQIFKLTTLKEGVIGSHFHYADNQVDLNGNKMSLQEFIGMFGQFGAPVEDGAPAQDAVPAPAQ